MKRNLLDIYLATFFTVRKVKNKSIMRVIFVSKMFKIEQSFQKCGKKVKKISIVSEIVASEDVAINCLF